MYIFKIQEFYTVLWLAYRGRHHTPHDIHNSEVKTNDTMNSLMRKEKNCIIQTWWDFFGGAEKAPASPNGTSEVRWVTRAVIVLRRQGWSIGSHAGPRMRGFKFLPAPRNKDHPNVGEGERKRWGWGGWSYPLSNINILKKTFFCTEFLLSNKKLEQNKVIYWSCYTQNV